jgi:creatinine amidohydrolase/Fe(II)-dependent formamide hydrolase-like protein
MPLPTWVTCVVSGVLSVALRLGTEVPTARAETPDPKPSPSETAEAAVKAADSDGDGVPDRPDLVSAGVTARVLDVAVEDLSQRSETVRVLVNPDGTSVQEAHAARCG